MAETVASVSSVNAAQFVRNFAECRTLAERQPVFVSSYGRTTHALIGLEQFEALQEAASQPRQSVEDGLVGAMLGDFGAWLDLGMIVCDTSLQVESVNPAARAMAGVGDDSAIGLPLDGALPGAQGSVLLTHAMRVATSRAPTTAEFPSPFQKDCWLRLRAFWWKEKVVLLVADITQEMNRERLADKSRSIADAFSLLPHMASVLLSPRGTIEGDGGPLGTMLGLAPDRLAGVGLVDLVDLPERPRFRAAVETVLRGGPAVWLPTRLISNTGPVLSVNAALAPMIGSYGSEGAVAVICQSGADQEEQSDDAYIPRATADLTI